jgi:hypothetical protein
MRRPSRSGMRPRPAASSWPTAASQPTRLKMKVMAGSRPSRSSSSMTSAAVAPRRGGRHGRNLAPRRRRPGLVPGRAASARRGPPRPPRPAPPRRRLVVPPPALLGGADGGSRSGLTRLPANRSNIVGADRARAGTAAPGRCSETTTSWLPRTSASQSPNSSALLTVGRQRHDLHVLGQVDDDLLPHRPAEPVGEVVHLVHDDVARPVRGCATPRYIMLRSTSVVITTTGASPLTEESPVSRPTFSAPCARRGRGTSGWTAP